LQRQQQRSWHDIVMLDESEFWLNTDQELIWLRTDEEILERDKHTVQSETVMLTIISNPSISPMFSRKDPNSLRAITSLKSLVRSPIDWEPKLGTRIEN
jgi:hypothetical protein